MNIRTIVTSVAHLSRKDKGFTLIADFAPNHGNQSLPPIDDLKRLVEDWIGANVWFNEHLTLRLYVRSCRIPRDSFEGVRIVGFRPNTSGQSSLDITMGLKGHDHKHRGYLDCGPGNTAVNLLNVTNLRLHQVLINYTARLIGEGEPLRQYVATQRTAARQALSKATNWRFVTKRAVIRKLCADLVGQSRERMIAEEMLLKSLQSAGINTDLGDEVRPILAELAARGIIEQPKSGTIMITEVTQEYANEWRLGEIRREKESLETSILNRQAGVKSLQSKARNLQKQLDEAQANLQRSQSSLVSMEERLRQITKEGEELTALSD